MPLSERDRVERQVLRHLIFHSRSPVAVRADDESCRSFDCDAPAALAECLAVMYESDYIRLLPGQGLNGDLLGPPSARSDASRRAERHKRLVGAFLSGASVMVTSEGIQRFNELRKKTSEVRLADWMSGKTSSGGGEWVRGEAPGAPGR